MPAEFINFLGVNRQFFLAFHILGFVLGLGSATLADFFLIRFLKDFKISDFELDVLKNFSKVIWFGLTIIILTGLALYLPESVRFNASAGFQMKMTAVLIIFLNGLNLNFIVTPSIQRIFVQEAKPLADSNLRKYAFASGAVSAVSWYAAFFVAMFKNMVQLSYTQFLGLYMMVLAFALLISFLAEKKFTHDARKSSNVPTPSPLLPSQPQVQSAPPTPVNIV